MNNLISNEISDHNVPDSSENDRLAILAQNGDSNARDQLVLNNLRLVIQLVNKYKQREEDDDDLIQDGICGVLRAINTYNSEKSAFSTHAYHWIKAMIFKSFREQEDFHYEVMFYNKYIRYEKLKSASGKNSDFTEHELADYNLTQKDIKQIEKYVRKSCSLDAIAEGGENYNTSNDKIYNPDDMVENTVYKNEVKRIVLKEMERLLTEKEFYIIRHVYGIGTDSPTKMVKIAEMYSKEFGTNVYTRQYIQQIKARAEKKLKKSALLRSLISL